METSLPHRSAIATFGQLYFAGFFRVMTITTGGPNRR
jgi:hypothetical protein